MIRPKISQNEIQQLRRGGAFQTNLFMLPAQINELLQREGTITMSEGKLILIFEKTSEFYRLYYCSSGVEKLTDIKDYILELKLNLPIVVDLVCRPEAAREISGYFKQIGFSQIETLIRMSVTPKQTAVYHNFEQVEWATESDVAQVERLLYQTFSVYVSRLPTQREISELIFENRILVERNQSQIIGLAIFKELSGRQVLLDQILVADSCKGSGVGKRLLQSGVVRFGLEKTISLWAIEKAVPFYEKFDFQRENRIDCILLYEGEKYGKNICNTSGPASGI